MKIYDYDESTKVLDENTPLTTIAEVLAICKEVDEETPTTEMDMFIATGHILVWENLDGYGIPTSRLTMIERYLSAHFAAITYTPSSFEAAGKVQVSYSTKVALGFDLTRYGQMAVRLDPTRSLKNLDEGKIRRASITWLGVTDAEREAIDANSQES